MDLESFLKSAGLAEVMDDTLVSILESCTAIPPAWDLTAKQPATAAPHVFDFDPIAAYASALKAETETESSSSSSYSSSPPAQVPEPDRTLASEHIKMEDEEDMWAEEASAPSSPSGSSDNDADFVKPTRTKAASNNNKAKGAARGNRGVSKKAAKRNWSRSHTRKEPTPDEFGSEEEYEQAWRRWRELRDNNNNAVKRSRENKKKLLPTPCRQQGCLHLHSSFEALQKKMNILVKAIRSPKELSTHERREYEAILNA